METRRNRLRLQAFRRGLLKPELKFSNTSYIREELVLFALAREENIRIAKEQLLFSVIATVNHTDRKKINDYIKEELHNIKQYNLMLGGSTKPFMSRKESVLHSMKSMIETWFELDENGTLDEWQRELDEELKNNNY